ncbi:ubiquitin-related domain-containing protein [Syncephalastrum racemosum]|uniref:Ubiquitin-related domain-containing protein n=1 Tax=Syncephalastrum racemosum TaxID=13706 RepID=A0A1X2H4T0_SYNRA|nr:ubiquitin-related domain-containing protein [Syncephalastrum racemosum]
MASDKDTLVSMGFSPAKVQKAWKATNGAGLQPAMDWLLEHPEVSDEPDPEEEGQSLTSTTTTSAPAGSTDNEEGEIKDGEQTAQSLMCNDCSKLFRDPASAERHAIRTSHQNFSESTEAIAPLTEEEKAAKLAELKARLAEKRALKAKQEEEEKRQSEKIRRKTGQEITDARAKMEEKEIKKAFEAKRREKEQDRLAKAKIKAQIEADKRERAAKREKAKQQQQEQQEQAQASAAAAAAASAPGVKKEYNEARLQFRVPGSGPLTQTFAADATLDEVYQYLKLQGCNEPFTLSTTFPRKTFAERDMSKSLKELNLVPSSALVLAYI